MKVYQVEDIREPLHMPRVICLGVFDGVHLGHRALIDEAMRIAKEKGLVSLVHTYDILPASLISTQKNVTELTKLKTRISLFEAMGVDEVAVSKFTNTMKNESGADFFERVLLNTLSAAHLVVGFNHFFGKNGDTNAVKLQVLCQQHGIGLSVIQPVRTQDGHLVSSSAIRAAILMEDYELAAQMLGRYPDSEMLTHVQAHYNLTLSSTSSEG